MQLSRVTFTFSGTWTAPAGVTSVLVTPTYAFSNFTGSPLLRTSTGVLYAWGRNTEGQIGDGTVADKSSPTLVIGGLTFIDVYATTLAVFGIDSNNNLYAWGQNFLGNLGVGDNSNRSSPTLVAGSLKFSSMLNTYGNNTAATIALTTDNRLYVWGSNSAGQLGLGDITNRSSPVLMAGGLLFNRNEAILANTFDPVTVPVTPGTTYTVAFNNAGTTFFNNVPIAYGELSRVSLEYEQ